MIERVHAVRQRCCTDEVGYDQRRDGEGADAVGARGECRGQPNRWKIEWCRGGRVAVGERDPPAVAVHLGDRVLRVRGDHGQVAEDLHDRVGAGLDFEVEFVRVA